MWFKTVWGRLFGPKPAPSPTSSADVREASQAFEREIEAALGVDRELQEAAERLRQNRARRAEALRKLESKHD